MERLPDREALTDELTVQEVILESLQDETFEGVEEERDEARREIVRLKKLLTQTLPTQPSRESTQPAFVPSPSTRRIESPAFATPRGSRMNNDDWLGPSARALPNRKRLHQLSFSNGGPTAKARRITPSPQVDRFSSPSSERADSVDIIDLTGEDVDFDAERIAAQIKQENQIKQELSDRNLAWQLSSQNGDSPPSTSPATDGPHSDVFRKMMGSQTQMANPYETAGESSSSRNHDPFVSLPGAYDPSWDRPYVGPQNSFGGPPGTLPSTPQYYPNVSPGQVLTMGARPSPQHPGHTSNGYAAPFFPPPHPPFPPIQSASSLYGVQRPPGLPSSNNASLVDTINRTSMYDYSTHVDADGNPFSERLSSYLEHAFHDPNVTEKELNDLLENIRPDMDLPDEHRDGTPPGLKSALYPHQQLAVAWMKKMEEGSNNGGILADDMGLGKTISTLALMLSRPSTSRTKTNLIVGPLALIRQWEEEIHKKTKLLHRLSVFVYHNKKTTTDELLRYDVVLTTYGTLAAELKRYHQFIEQNGNRNIDFNDKANAVKFPLLHPSKAVYYRVILDEAQCIKNDKTKTAKACHMLQSTYRWCLTGTPMMNGVKELFSLVRFLRIKPYCDWGNFRQAFGVFIGKTGDPKSVAMSRLRALLKAIMLRRKKDSKLDGKPILNLPPKTESIVYATLSDDEMAFYKQLEERSQVLFSKYLRENSVGKNYTNILVLLLRMRQACCHPHLNLDVEDAISDADMIASVKALDARTVERIKERITETEAFECPICFDAVQSPSFFVPCGHDSCKDCLTRLVDGAATENLQAGRESDAAKCPVCRSSFEAKKCFSYEAFRSVHMKETIVKTSESDVEELEDDDSESESENGDEADDVDEKGNLKGFIVDDDFYDSDEERAISPSKRSKVKKGKKSKGKQKASDVKPSMLKTLRKEAAKSRPAYKKYMRYLTKTWMPAAKVTECMKLLKSIQEGGEWTDERTSERKAEKTIIFSQWTLLLDLLQVAMHHENFDHKPLRYDGSMSSDERVKAARDFRDKANAKVMLVSLRAGNAGLNLTSASNVIIMDPFWNPYIEMQAVDRAYRIGQQREVKVYRILTKQTVEDRIIELQERKKEIVEAALDETESMKIGRLNVNELRFLFNTRD
ncbi:hypothetical protein HIM_08089 [Hirsutella minnesotensis 3608]|uniref:ATP-dependent helicase C23E6.02 n=1 Tax=Hirsutella minnesotensis 3608 TaxID=1043627 RepID=A0A0F7ZMT6_9HYPO|nr:hypothetical protein HIM_08089 [Hirsutella minnesotensis 3608]